QPREALPMKFLCVPCDSPMKLQSVGPPDRGSLSIVYSCPECGYEMAMLTNAYETQAVQSLGVKIGPDRLRAEGVSAGPADVSDRLRAEGAPASESKCPFSAMIPSTDTTQPQSTGESASVRWTAAAEARLANIPEFVRPMARTGIERFAREQGAFE